METISSAELCTGAVAPMPSTRVRPVAFRLVWTSSAERLRTYLRTICGLEVLDPLQPKTRRP
jgi:hypothetical protein